MKVGEVRRVRVTGVCDTLVLLVSKDPRGDRMGNDWTCEDLRTGRERVIDPRHMSEETYNEMEVLAWASR
jgi:hypothetical protein